MLSAITRKPSPELMQCELGYLERQPIDIELMLHQHAGYEAVLARLGARVVSLPALPGFPDAVFVEDPAVVVDELAIVTRLGAESRRGEVESLVQALTPFRDVHRLIEPATLEGGDVLRIGKTMFVGCSKRTNEEGIRQLRDVLVPLGYEVVPVKVTGCLHLKTGCCAVSDDTLLVNCDWIDTSAFNGFRLLDAPDPWATNVLRLGNSLLIPSGFPRTCDLLDRQGFHTESIDISELMKAEAGLTCLSLLFNATPAPLANVPDAPATL